MLVPMCFRGSQDQPHVQRSSRKTHRNRQRDVHTAEVYLSGADMISRGVVRDSGGSGGVHVQPPCAVPLMRATQTHLLPAIRMQQDAHWVSAQTQTRGFYWGLVT